MPYLSDEWLQELNNRINIADLVSNYATLKSKSGRLWACCPFHNEKTPSFSVNPSKGLYHCFGCGKGGNAIQFIMDIEHLTFPEACIYIAEKINFPLPNSKHSKVQKNEKSIKSQLLEINRIAFKYFRDSLKNDSYENAKNYLNSRNLNSDIINRFGIGYAPDSWDGLISILQSKGYRGDLIVKSGLARHKSANYYDVFRNRIIFPICNTRGEIIAFGGRIIDEGEPKYLNSPETLVFNKSRNLYNLNNVKEIRNLEYIILTEGYMDVIALDKYGISNSVATLGTSLTPDQVRLLKRFNDNIYVSYDGDSAGQKAALRAIDLFKKEGMDIRIISIPDNMDPDEFLSANGAEGYNRLIKNAKQAVEFKIDLIALNYNLEDGAQKEKFAKESIEILKLEDKSVTKEKYAKYIAELTGFSLSSIMQDIKNTDAKINTFPKNIEPHREDVSVNNENEDFIIMRLFENPLLINDYNGQLSPGLFWNKTNRAIYNYIFIQNKRGFQPTVGEILNIVEEHSELNRITKLLMSSDTLLNNGKKSIKFFIDSINKLLIRNKTAELNSYCELEKNSINSKAKAKISSEISRISKELYALKEKTKD